MKKDDSTIFQAPDDAQYFRDKIYYKKGSHGFVFYWVEEYGWLKSTRSPAYLNERYRLYNETYQQAG